MKEGEEVGGEETREVGGIQTGGEAGGIKLYRAGEGQGYLRAFRGVPLTNSRRGKVGVGLRASVSDET